MRFRVVLLLATLTAACGGDSAATGDAATGDAATTGDGARVDAASGHDAGSCGVPTDSPVGVIDGEITVAGTDRTYVLSVPTSYDPEVPLALVFAWHGRGSTAEQARAYYGVEEAAAGAAIVVYPQGLPVSSLGNDTGWELTANGRDLALYDALLARLTADYCVDPARIFSTGHSFGGYLSNELACLRGDSVRAIAAVASGGPFNLCTSDGSAVWLAHGTLDSVVPFEQGVASRDHWREANGCSDATEPVDPSPCVRYQSCDAGRPLIWCQHDDPAFAGHTWPSFATTGIWAFFDSLD